MHRSQRNPNFSSTVPCDLAVKILKRIPPEHRHSFTTEQVKALQNALAEKRQKQPNLKVTLGPFYLSLTAGRSQRSTLQRSHHSILVPVLCMMVSMVGTGCVAGLMQFRYGYQAAHANTAFQTDEESFHPTVLPFRKNQSNCEKNGAAWIDRECVDPNHDPTF
ncbi:hypothetical protein [Leptothoe spongobia]|uniref:Uncharacterized protein n=1 Tax=Leptothoe spongobia TAU-MAC 1115 TaxID=1967444 RepID=A0A947DE85_9CYAN|nr:hypothetical protein [Leptothoe spongobia]MBT9315392.1 hypothetical protein [Leptothoe spongobia TAU-MAC 1115]